MQQTLWREIKKGGWDQMKHSLLPWGNWIVAVTKYQRNETKNRMEKNDGELMYGWAWGKQGRFNHPGANSLAVLRYDEMYGITSGAVPRNAMQTVL